MMPLKKKNKPSQYHLEGETLKMLTIVGSGWVGLMGFCIFRLIL